MRRLLALSLVLAACSPASQESPAASGSDSPEAAIQAAPTGSHVSGRADFDTASGSLDADLTVRLDPGDQPETAFMLSGALEITEVSGTAVEGFRAAPMEEGGSWDLITVELDRERAPGPVEIRFLYSGAPTMPESRINQISPDWVELSVDSAWHPIPSNLDEEFTIDLEIGLPQGWTVVTPGEATPLADGYHLQNDVPHGDIVFTAAPELEVASGEGAAVYHRGASPETTAAVLEAAATCRDYLDRRFGASGRLPDGRFVIPDRLESGYARKNYIALTRVDERDERSLTQFLCHELAHFWSSGAAWLSVDNWLNEGFAVLVAAQALRELYGEEAWLERIADWTERSEDQPSVWTPDDLSRRPYAVNYKKAPLALSKLEERIGPEAFDRVVVRYMTDPINDTPTLLEVVGEEAGPEAREWFEQMLGD